MIKAILLWVSRQLQSGLLLSSEWGHFGLRKVEKKHLQMFLVSYRSWHILPTNLRLKFCRANGIVSSSQDIHKVPFIASYLQMNDFHSTLESHFCVTFHRAWIFWVCKSNNCKTDSTATWCRKVHQVQVSNISICISGLLYKLINRILFTMY